MTASGGHKHFEANFGYQNSAYAYSQPHLSTLSVTKYVSPEEKYLKRSASSASQFVSASRMSGLNEVNTGPPVHPVQLSAGQLTGYQRNEFDTSKFTTGLAFRTQSQYDLPSFGLDPDEPIFVTGPYGKGGLQPDYRPFSALSGARAPPSWRPRSANERPDSSLQWYRPRSLANLEDDTSSIWSGMGPSRPQEFTQVPHSNRHGNHATSLMNYFLQSLDRRKMAQSTGALHHFGYHSEDGILRGSVAPFMHFSTTSDSKQSIGQFSDHIDKYRDVAL